MSVPKATAKSKTNQMLLNQPTAVHFVKISDPGNITINYKHKQRNQHRQSTKTI